MSQLTHRSTSHRFTSRRLASRLAAAGATAALVAIGATACGPADDAPGDKDKGTTASSSAQPGDKAAAGKAPASKTPAKPKVKPAFKGSGTFQVGKDVQPGTYRSSGNPDGLCYWERAKDAKGDTDSILANDNVKGGSYVTIAKTDKVFKSTDCDDWFAVSAAKGGAPKTKVSGDGMYKIGTDIQPGTYKSVGNSDGCYWERDKDALHGLNSIKANDNVTGTGLVTITATDAYFKTSGCTDWAKTG